MSGLTRTQWDYDVRVRQRNLKRGLLKADDVQSHIDALPDVAELAEVMTLDAAAAAAEEDTSIDDDDDDDDDESDDDAEAEAGEGDAE